MAIFIAADHRGFDLKNKLIDYLQQKNIRVEDLGNYELDPDDDYVDFAQNVAKTLQAADKPEDAQENLGVVICGSGVGMCIAVNRFKKVRCGLGFNPKQIRHARQADHINVLSLSSDFVDFEKAKKILTAFLETSPKDETRYSRRIKKIEDY